MIIQHRAGAKHSNADGLSRIPNSTKPCTCYEASKNVETLPCKGCKYCSKLHNQWSRFENDVDDVLPVTIREIVMTSQDTSNTGTTHREASDEVDDDENTCNYMATYQPQQLRDLQVKDSDLKPIITWLESNKEQIEGDLFLQSAATKHTWQCKSQLTLQEGVLYYKWEEGNETRLKLVVPQSLKDEVLRHVHDSKAGGHFGRDKTTQKAKRSFYWYHMNLDTELYIRTYSICSRKKKKKHLITEELD